MASPDSSKSTDISPSNHPMILRSACRLCCAAESPLSPDIAVDHVVHHRNVHKSRVKGDLHFHHHHHHHHPHHNLKKSYVSEEYVVQNTDYAEPVSKTVKNKSSSEINKKITTSSEKNIAFKLANSLHKSSLVEQITSIDVAAVAKKLMSSSSVNFLSTSMQKEVYSDYSSGDESNEFYCGGEINNFHIEDMSRTRAQRRIPLSSARFVAESDDSEDRVNIKSVFQGRHDENLRTLSTHLVDRKVDDVGLSKVLHYSNSGEKVHKAAASRSNHLYSVEGSVNNTLHSDEVYVEGSLASSALSQSPPFPYSESVFTMLRWLFWRCFYHNICEVLLLDTWILSRCHTFGKKKILLALLLLLIPLWLLGFFSPEKYSGDLADSNGILKSEESWGSLFSYSFLSTWFTRSHQESSSVPICNNNPETCDSTWSGIWNIFSVEEREENSGKSDFPSSDKLNVELLIPSSEISEEKIKLLALEVFKKESNQLMKELEKRSSLGQREQGDVKVVLHEMNLMTSQYQSLSDSVQTLKSEIREQMKSDAAENIQSHPQLLLLNSKLQDVQEKLESFETLLASAKNCCENQSDILLAESHLNSMLMKMMDGSDNENHPIFSAFRSWLKSNFISRKNLSDEIAFAMESMYGNSLKLPQEHYENIARKVAESVISKSMKTLKHDIINISKTTSSVGASGHYAQSVFGVDDVQKIVKEAILLYDADKTARVDYALESGGGSIISTRCSETYYAGTARLSIFGLPLWYTSKSPRTAIQPEVQPGECWAFQGSRGYLVIQLSATIKPSGFSMEHIPKSLSPTGNIDSAPKEFSVWGLTLEEKDEGKLLGEYTYESDADPLQYFPVQMDSEDYFSVVELKILSNWGNQKYTCLYRFRVHGTPL